MFAQGLGVKFHSGSVLSMPHTNSFFDNQSLQPNLGFIVGAGSEIQMTQHWTVGLDIALLSAKHSVVNANPSIQTQYKHTFIQTPIGLKYYIFTKPNRFSPYLIAGISSNILLSARTQGTYPNVFNNEYNDVSGTESFLLERNSSTGKSNYRSHFFAGYTGAGASLWSTTKYNVGMEVRYAHGLQNILKSTNGNLSFYNRFLTAGIQLQFRL